jgi:hypothetical protein
MKKIEEKNLKILEAENVIEGKEFRVHDIWVRVSKTLYGKVYYASQRTGASMSFIGNMCIEKSLDEVENEIMRKGKKR